VSPVCVCVSWIVYRKAVLLTWYCCCGRRAIWHTYFDRRSNVRNWLVWCDWPMNTPVKPHIAHILSPVEPTAINSVHSKLTPPFHIVVLRASNHRLPCPLDSYLFPQQSHKYGDRKRIKVSYIPRQWQQGGVHSRIVQALLLPPRIRILSTRNLSLERCSLGRICQVRRSLQRTASHQSNRR
jgi:hypothetical protein